MVLQFQGFPTWEAPQGILFRAWYFEPLVAIVSFLVWIQLWWFAERQQGLSRINHFQEYLANPLQGYTGWSLMAYCLGIYVWKMFIPPVADHIPDGLPSSMAELVYLLAEVSSGIVLYDFLFFFVHWGMHEIPCLRRIHHSHHKIPAGTTTTVEACDVIQNSFFDGSLQVLVNILVQRQTPWGMVKSRLARVLHNILVTSMLTESHTAAAAPYIWRRWFVGVREHRFHHLHNHDGGRRTQYGWMPPSSSSLADDAEHNTTKFHHKFDRHQQFFGYLDNLRFWLLQNSSSGRFVKQ